MTVELEETKDLQEVPSVVPEDSRPKLMAGMGPFEAPKSLDEEPRMPEEEEEKVGRPGAPEDQKDPVRRPDVTAVSPRPDDGAPPGALKPGDRARSPPSAVVKEDKPRRRKRFIRPGVCRVCPDGTLKGRDNKPVLDSNGKPIICPIVNGEPKTDDKKYLVDRDGQRLKGPYGQPIRLGQGSHGPRVGPNGKIYKPDGSLVLASKRKPLTAGFMPDGRVRVNRHGAIKGPDRKKLTDRKSDRVYVSKNPYVGVDGAVYKPDGSPFLDNVTKEPLRAQVDRNKLPRTDENGNLIGLKDLPLKDKDGNTLVNGTGPIVYKGVVMLPIGRPLTDPKSKTVLKAGVTEEGLPMVDGENCALDPKGEVIKGKDGKPVLLYPHENGSVVEDFDTSKAELSESEDEEDDVETTEPILYDSEATSEDLWTEEDVTVELEETKDLQEVPSVVPEDSRPKLMAGMGPFEAPKSLDEEPRMPEEEEEKVGRPGAPEDQKDPVRRPDVTAVSPRPDDGAPPGALKPGDRARSPPSAVVKEDKPRRRKRFIRPGVCRVCPDGTLKGRDNKPVLDSNGKPIICPIVNGEPKTDNKKYLVDRDGQRLKGPYGQPIRLGQGSHGPRVGPNGKIYKPDGSLVLASKKKPLTAGFMPDGRVRVNRHGAIKGPDRKKLTDRKSDRVYVSKNPYVGVDGAVYKPDGSPFLDNVTKEPLRAQVDRNKLPRTDENGNLIGLKDLPLKDKDGNTLVNGTGPIVYKGVVMLPIGRPLTDPKSKTVLKAGVTEEGLPMVDGENCALDPKGEVIKGKDGKPVLLYPHENGSVVEDFDTSKAELSESEDEEDDVETTEPILYDSEATSEDLWTEEDVTVELEETKDLQEVPSVVPEDSRPKLMAGMGPFEAPKSLDEEPRMPEEEEEKVGRPGAPEDQKDPVRRPDVTAVSPRPDDGAPPGALKPGDRARSPPSAVVKEDKPRRRKRFIRPGVCRVCPDGTLKGRDNKPVLDSNGKPIICPIVNGEPKTDNKKYLVDRDGQRLKGPYGQPIRLGQGSHGPRVGPNGKIYKPDGSLVLASKKKPLTAGFMPDGRVRVNRHGAIKGPDRKKLTDRKSDRVYVSKNPYVGVDGAVYKPDGSPFLDNVTKEPLRAQVDRNKLPRTDENGNLIGLKDLPLKDKDGNTLVNGTGPIVYKGVVMLPIGRPLTDPKSKTVLKAGVTEEGLPMVDGENCALDPKGEVIKGKDGKPVLLYPHETSCLNQRTKRTTLKRPSRSCTIRKQLLRTCGRRKM